MTVRITGRHALVRALHMLGNDIAGGRVASCSLHYEPTSVARLSVCYLTDEGEVSNLPGIPGVIEVDEETQS